MISHRQTITYMTLLYALIAITSSHAAENDIGTSAATTCSIGMLQAQLDRRAMIAYLRSEGAQEHACKTPGFKDGMPCMACTHEYAADYDNDGSLSQAVRSENVDAVERFLQMLPPDILKGEINKPDSKGNTPLMVACHNNNEQIIRLLLAAGADITAHNTGLSGAAKETDNTKGWLCPNNRCNNIIASLDNRPSGITKCPYCNQKAKDKKFKPTTLKK